MQRRVILAGIKVTAQFAMVRESEDGDSLEPEAKGLTLAYPTLTQFAAEATSNLRAAWEELRREAALVPAQPTDNLPGEGGIPQPGEHVQ